ncbi:hypothetical protein [Pseudomonas sp. M30-35]|uniref:hypothetical protein n=1 Tax=Pseudomonas sp. M30-35 TaxID=1981174 RepID=UPI000B3CF3D0|nr:hypothetical protein [Pseudomonas sp. M30-35]ARU88450.1 hypothetical protein B9K09_10960 [Pseudomonas sp. M30-35]
MADDLSAIEGWAGALINKLQPNERRQLNTRYDRRELLGSSSDDLDMIRDSQLLHIAGYRT